LSAHRFGKRSYSGNPADTLVAVKRRIPAIARQTIFNSGKESTYIEDSSERQVIC